MRIGLATWGSDGDVRPMMALAGGLRKAGHDVKILIIALNDRGYEKLAEKLDVKIYRFIELPIEKNLAMAEKIRRTNIPFRQVKLLMDEDYFPLQEQVFNVASEMADECDLLISHHILGAVKAAAEKRQKHYASVFYCHNFIPSCEVAVHPVPYMGPLLNRLVWGAGNLLIRPIITRGFNKLRKNHGLNPLTDLFYTGWKSDRLNLVATSSIFCHRPSDWKNTDQVCGFFYVPPERDEWGVPPDLQSFLDSGEPPVYLTFGSMTQMALERSTELLVNAAKLSGKRSIIQSNWGQVKNHPKSADIFMAEKIPHHDVFPKCALVVHHGGAGTTQSSTYCGIPSVVVAHAFDQDFWGSELKRIGVGGEVLNIRDATPETLAAQIRKLYDSAEIREKVRKVGDAMREENGVTRAVRLIESTFNG